VLYPNILEWKYRIYGGLFWRENRRDEIPVGKGRRYELNE